MKLCVTTTINIYNDRALSAVLVSHFVVLGIFIVLFLFFHFTEYLHHARCALDGSNE